MALRHPAAGSSVQPDDHTGMLAVHAPHAHHLCRAKWCSQARRLGACLLSASCTVCAAAVCSRQHDWGACQAALDQAAPGLGLDSQGSSPKEWWQQAMQATEHLLVQADAAIRQDQPAQGAKLAASALAMAKKATSMEALLEPHERQLTARVHLCLAEAASAGQDIFTAKQHCQHALQALNSSQGDCVPQASLLHAAVLALQASLLNAGAAPDKQQACPSGSRLLSCQLHNSTQSSQHCLQHTAAAKSGRSTRKHTTAREAAVASGGTKQLAQEAGQLPDHVWPRMQLLAQAYGLCHTAPDLARCGSSSCAWSQQGTWAPCT